tara:strand:+ start:1231 stop:1395 length:165 start_codon:yes stop_codon:yes gene_type:complete
MSDASLDNLYNAIKQAGIDVAEKPEETDWDMKIAEAIKAYIEDLISEGALSSGD